MSINYNESLTNIVNAYIGKESLSMLLLASSILFYDLAKKHSDNIPKSYALSIAILLILYSAILGIHSNFEFTVAINDIITKCKKNNCDVDLNHFERVKNFYIYMGIIYSLILIFISYVLIRFDK